MRIRQGGRVEVVQVVGVVVLAAALYFGFMYLPVLTHRMAMADIARRYAARMLVDFNDGKLREEIFQQAKKETGIQIGMSELFLQRKQQPSSTHVTIKWTEQVKHIWGGSPHVIKMSVTESADNSGGKLLKNAE